jgi:AraC family cel operon transcriptional repressor
MEILKITSDYHIDQILQATLMVCSVKHCTPIHYHDYYEFFLITKGGCFHSVNDETQHLKEGTLVFIRPNDIHSYSLEGELDCEFINIACTKEIISDLFQYLSANTLKNKLLNNLMPPYSLLSQMEKENFVSAFERVKMLATVDKELSRLHLKNLLVEIFSMYFSSNHSIESCKLPLWMGTLLTQMQKEDNFRTGLDKLYELSGKSAGHVNRAFRQYLRETPTFYINQLRLDFAKTLLLTTDLSILDISIEVGIDNLSYFYHLFKERFGITPSDFRKTRSSN